MFYYPLNNAPARILDLISACKVLTRKVFEDQPGDQISGAEALTYVKTEGTEDIIPRINKYLYEHPNDAQAYNDRGMEYLRLQDNSKALEDFTTAIELNPKFDMAYYNRSWVFYSQAEWEKAIHGQLADWKPLKPSGAIAASGASFTIAGDGALLLGGATAESDL